MTTSHHTEVYALGRSVSPKQIVVAFSVLVDVACIMGCAVLACAIYSSTMDAPLDFSLFLTGGCVSALIFIILAAESGHYNYYRLLAKSRNTKFLLFRWFETVLIISFILFLFKQGAEVSRGATIIFGLLGIVALPMAATWRVAVIQSLIKARIFLPVRLAVVGTPGLVDPFIQAARAHSPGIQFVGPYLLSDAPDATPAGDARILEEAVAGARRGQVEALMLAVPWGDPERMEAIRAKLRILPLPVHLVPDATAAMLRTYPVVQFGFSTTVELQREPLTTSERIAKRCMDLSLASLGLLLISPLMLLVALAIKLDGPGPVLFRQRRIGFDGHVFMILKFRTMTVEEDGEQIVQAHQGDKRVTRLGYFLRKLSIDELPQLLNVIRGEMSLVGPRPHALAHSDHYKKLLAAYAFRHHVKPGITGWAQIHGLRGETPRLSQMEARIQYDLEYIASWSLLLDIWILLRTVYEVLRGRNAV